MKYKFNRSSVDEFSIEGEASKIEFHKQNGNFFATVGAANTQEAETTNTLMLLILDTIAKFDLIHVLDIWVSEDEDGHQLAFVAVDKNNEVALLGAIARDDEGKIIDFDGHYSGHDAAHVLGLSLECRNVSEALKHAEMISKFINTHLTPQKP